MSDEEENDRIPRRDVYETKRFVRNQRAQYYQEVASSGGYSAITHQRLQAAVLRYWDTLHEFGDEEAIAEEWEDNDLDRIPELADKTVTVDVNVPGYGGTTSTERKPAISTLSAKQLIDLTHKLDDIAKMLGFSADIKESTNNTEITDEMVEEVEEWRQRTLD